MLLRAAYAAGIFPMADARTGKIGWYCPDPRGVLPLESFRIPRNLARLVRQRRFEIRIDTAFAAVLDACAGPRSRDDEGWMSPVLRQAYVELHREGEAHSVEAWRDGTLAGGLFGVALGGLFTSESMFHRVSDAGNAALVATHAHLLERGYTLWDIQTATDHTRRFGLLEMSHQEYLAVLRTALEHPRDFGGSADASRVR